MIALGVVSAWCLLLWPFVQRPFLQQKLRAISTLHFTLAFHKWVSQKKYKFYLTVFLFLFFSFKVRSLMWHSSESGVQRTISRFAESLVMSMYHISLAKTAAYWIRFLYWHAPVQIVCEYVFSVTSVFCGPVSVFWSTHLCRAPFASISCHCHAGVFVVVERGRNLVLPSSFRQLGVIVT